MIIKMTMIWDWDNRDDDIDENDDNRDDDIDEIDENNNEETVDGEENLQRSIADLPIVVPVKRVKRFPGNENSDHSVVVKILESKFL